MIGVGNQSPKWFITFVKAAISNHDYKVLLHNFLHHAATLEVQPPSETQAERLSRIARAKEF
jgi:hypothetical protein